MSLLKILRAQLGLSGTATNNFTITAEAADGSMKLARGNAGATTQDVLTVSAAGKVAAPQGYSDVFGSGQSWQDVTASRAKGTTYTNSTGKPILLNIYGNSSGGAGNYWNLTVDGVVIAQSPQGYTAGASISIAGIPIQNGSTYSLADGSGGTSINKWSEFR